MRRSEVLIQIKQLVTLQCADETTQPRTQRDVLKLDSRHLACRVFQNLREFVQTRCVGTSLSAGSGIQRRRKFL